MTDQCAGKSGVVNESWSWLADVTNQPFMLFVMSAGERWNGEADGVQEVP